MRAAARPLSACGGIPRQRPDDDVPTTRRPHNPGRTSRGACAGRICSGCARRRFARTGIRVLRGRGCEKGQQNDGDTWPGEGERTSQCGGKGPAGDSRAGRLRAGAGGAARGPGGGGGPDMMAAPQTRGLVLSMNFWRDRRCACQGRRWSSRRSTRRGPAFHAPHIYSTRSSVDSSVMSSHLLRPLHPAPFLSQPSHPQARPTPSQPFPHHSPLSSLSSWAQRPPDPSACCTRRLPRAFLRGTRGMCCAARATA